MNLYSALYAHGESPIGKFAWGSIVLSSVNLQLPEGERFTREDTCRTILNRVLEFDNPIRDSFLHMDVPVSTGEEIEQLKESGNHRILALGTGGLAMMALLILAGYMYATSTGGEGPDAGILKLLLDFVGNLLQGMQQQAAPAQ